MIPISLPSSPSKHPNFCKDKGGHPKLTLPTINQAASSVSHQSPTVTREDLRRTPTDGVEHRSSNNQPLLGVSPVAAVVLGGIVVDRRTHRTLSGLDDARRQRLWASLHPASDRYLRRYSPCDRMPSRQRRKVRERAAWPCRSSSSSSRPSGRSSRSSSSSTQTARRTRAGPRPQSDPTTTTPPTRTSRRLPRTATTRWSRRTSGGPRRTGSSTPGAR